MTLDSTASYSAQPKEDWQSSSKAPAKRSWLATNWFKFTIVAGFCLLMLGVDLFFGWNAWQQLRTVNYPNVKGTVVSCEVVPTRQEFNGESQSHCHPEVAYEYRVGDQLFRGTRLRYGDDQINSVDYSLWISTTYRAGAKVPVYYNPENPADSVLRCGLEGMDLFLLLIVVVTNVIGATIVSLLLRIWTGSQRLDLVEFQQGTKTFLRQTRSGATYAGVGAFCSLATLQALAGLTWFGTTPPLILMIFVWLISVLGTLWVYRTTRQYLSSKPVDLILDRQSKTITLPTVDSRKNTPLTVGADHVGRIEVKASRLFQGLPLKNYLVTVAATHQQGSRQYPVFSALEESRAHQMALHVEKWIQDQLRSSPAQAGR